ncbi:MAG: hypothetical protein ACR2NR_05040 [Solirubrobacteraceae bacterium]
MDLDAYRVQAESFSTELGRAYYRHLAGHDTELPLEQIYGRHAALFERDAVLSLQAQAQATAPGTDERRRARNLWDFALEGHMGQLTKATEAELARREVSISLAIAGESEPIGFRESSVVQANEPDADRRAAIEHARNRATAEQLGDLHRELIECQHATATELGFASYRELCEESKGIDLGALQAQTAAFTAATDGQLGGMLDHELQRSIGLRCNALRRSDIPRFRRAPVDDAQFPQDQLVPSFLSTMRCLGIDPESQSGVVLDLASRPGKAPRAFCSPVRVPDEVYLVLTPIGGREDYAILFHEGGHTEQFAHIAPELAFEFRCLGDAAATEVFAFLIQHLTEDPGWLARHLGIGDSASLAGFGRASRFIYLRQYAAKLSYELELHGGEHLLEQMPARYSELLGSGLGIPWSADTSLSDVDPGFYCAGYLRAWALEAHLRRHLRDRFGAAWFEVPEAGAWLRSMWGGGLRLNAEELLLELTGETLDFAFLLEDLGLAGGD